MVKELDWKWVKKAANVRKTFSQIPKSGLLGEKCKEKKGCLKTFAQNRI